MTKDPQPRFIHMKNLKGEFVAPKDRAEAIAARISRTNIGQTALARLSKALRSFKT